MSDPRDGIAAIVFVNHLSEVAVEARQIVRDGLRAAGMMPRVLPRRKSKQGRHLRAGRFHYTLDSGGYGGEYRMTPGDLPGENGMPPEECVGRCAYGTCGGAPDWCGGCCGCLGGCIVQWENSQPQIPVSNPDDVTGSTA